MLNLFLADSSSSSLSSQWPSLVILVVLIVAIIVMFVFSSRRRKKQEQDAQNLIDAVKPGNKVKTIGGICGIVVEVDSEENTFILETGSEQSGKCYIKFDRQDKD
jgi:preprotein translocase subunit YajC